MGFPCFSPRDWPIEECQATTSSNKWPLENTKFFPNILFAKDWLFCLSGSQAAQISHSANYIHHASESRGYFFLSRICQALHKELIWILLLATYPETNAAIPIFQANTLRLREGKQLGQCHTVRKIQAGLKRPPGQAGATDPTMSAPSWQQAALLAGGV